MWSRSLISRNVALAPVGSSRTHWAGAHVLGRQAMQPSGVDEYRLTSKIRSPERPSASALPSAPHSLLGASRPGVMTQRRRS
jgi:hypothetical protein